MPSLCASNSDSVEIRVSEEDLGLTTPNPIFPYTFILLIIFGLLLSIGLVSVRRIVGRDTDVVSRRRTAFPIWVMSAAGLSIFSICAVVMLCRMASIVGTTLIVRQFDKVNCLEARITGEYRIIVAERRDGHREASVADARGKEELIWVEQYSVTENFLVGITDGDYFWLDQRTGGRRIFDRREEFVESLKVLGVSQVPDLMPIDTLCNAHQCQPCATFTPTP